MTKTKKQLRAEAVERLKNCVAARFDAESIVIALTSGRHGQSDWSLECDKLIYLLTDDANDDSTPENGVSDPKVHITPESCRQYADQRKQGDDADCESCDSREKLEADVWSGCDHLTMLERGPVLVNVPWDRLLGWLDRQAAITEEKTRYKWVTASAEEIAAWRSKAEKLKEQVYELTAERDKLQELNEYNALQYELASEDADEKWNLYVEEHGRADRLATDLGRCGVEREMYRDTTTALMDCITEGLTKVDAILGRKDEGLA